MFPYRSVTDAIDTFPTAAPAVGIRPAGGCAEIYASFGLSDLLSGAVCANRKQINRDIYEAKPRSGEENGRT
ncbi:nucleotidyltransferase family protein [Acetobacter senegalensis]|uniref:nucleotidyltransferase family protein n=1 Tax=Acetobacter senegalensis TaxID=446692 RepID=UPI003427C6D1